MSTTPTEEVGSKTFTYVEIDGSRTATLTIPDSVDKPNPAISFRDVGKGKLVTFMLDELDYEDQFGKAKE